MKKILLISTVIFLGIFSVVNAQVYTLGAAITVNTTATGAGAYPAPFNNVDQAEHQQYLILASELTALGATAGNITQLAYFMTVKNTNNAAKKPLQIIL
jgi:hypothetical protein